MGQWTQLLPFLNETCVSPNVSHREVAIFILFTVLESIVEGFEDKIADFFELFRRLLQDPDSLDVRITTVR